MRMQDEFPDIQLDKWTISNGIKAEWKSKLWYEKILYDIWKTVQIVELLQLTVLPKLAWQ